MKPICIFIPLFLLLIAGCTSTTSLPTIDIEVALQQTLTAMVIDVGLPAIQLSDTEIPTQRSTDTPTILPTEILTNIPNLIIPDISDCIPYTNAQEIGLVTHVIDGDTIEVLINNQVFTVQYIGIDSPETSELGQQGNYLATSATEKNREMLEGQIITLVKDVSETDQNNHLLRYIYISDLDGVFVNHELVKLGYANVLDSPPDIACSEYFKLAEREAKVAKVGIWAPTPTFAPFPTPTLIPTQPPTPIPTPKPTKVPTNTSKPPIPYITMTPIRQPTVTCWVSPSIIPGGTNTSLMFYARFSPPQAGDHFEIISFDPHYGGGVRWCVGIDVDGYGIASCEGSSGMIPFRKTITVTFNTLFDKCYATFATQ